MENEMHSGAGIETGDRKNVLCNELFCRLGCVCDSLAVHNNHQMHCRKILCMFSCRCLRQSILEMEHNTENRKRSKREPERYHTEIADKSRQKPLLNSATGERLSNSGIGERVSTPTAGTSVAPQEHAVGTTAENAASNLIDSEKQQRIQHAVNRFRHCEVSLKRLPKAAASLEPWCMVHQVYKCVCMLGSIEKAVSVAGVKRRAEEVSPENAVQSSASAIDSVDEDYRKKRIMATTPPRARTPHSPPTIPTSPQSPSIHHHLSPSAFPTEVPRSTNRCGRSIDLGSTRQCSVSIDQPIQPLSKNEFGDQKANDTLHEQISLSMDVSEQDKNEIKGQSRHESEKSHLVTMTLIDFVVNESDVDAIHAQHSSLQSIPKLNSRPTSQMDHSSDYINHAMDEIVYRQKNNKHIRNMTRSDILQWYYFRQLFHNGEIYLWYVRSKMNDIWLCLTLANEMPKVSDALCVSNVVATPFTQLPLLAQLLLYDRLESPQFNQLALLVCPNANYWKIASVFFSRDNYLSDDTVNVSVIQSNNPGLLQKFNRKLKLLKSSHPKETESEPRPNPAISSKLHIDDRKSKSEIFPQLAARAANIPLSASRSVNRLFLPVPEVGHFRWLMLTLGEDFSHILIPSWRSVITYDRLAAASIMARENNKIVMISASHIVPDVYMLPKSPNLAFFGPYALDAIMDLQLLCKHNIVESTNLKKTVGCWLLSPSTRDMTMPSNEEECGAKSLANDVLNDNIDEDCMTSEIPDDQIEMVSDNQPINNMQVDLESANFDDKGFRQEMSLVEFGEINALMTRPSPLRVSVSKLDSDCSEVLATEASVPVSIPMNADEPNISRASAVAASILPSETLLRVITNSVRNEQPINISAQGSNFSDAELWSATSTPTDATDDESSVIITIEELDIVRARAASKRRTAVTPTSHIVRVYADAKIPIASSTPTVTTQVTSNSGALRSASSFAYEALLRPLTPLQLQQNFLPMQSSLSRNDRASVLLQSASRLTKACDIAAETIANFPPMPLMPTAASTWDSSSKTSIRVLPPTTADTPKNILYLNSAPSMPMVSMVQHPEHPLIHSITVRKHNGMTILDNSAELTISAETRPSNGTNRIIAELPAANGSLNLIYQNTTSKLSTVAEKRRRTSSPLSMNEIAANIQRRLPSGMVITPTHRTNEQIQEQQQEQKQKQQQPLPLAIITKLPPPRKPSLQKPSPQKKSTHSLGINNEQPDPVSVSRSTVTMASSEALSGGVFDTQMIRANQQPLPSQPPPQVAGWLICSRSSALGRIRALFSPLGLKLRLFDIGIGAQKWTELLTTCEAVNQQAEEHIGQFLYAYQPRSNKLQWYFVHGDQLSEVIADMQVYAPERWPDCMVLSTDAGLIDLRKELDINRIPEQMQSQLNMLRVSYICHVDQISAGDSTDRSSQFERNGNDNVCLVIEQLTKYVTMQHGKYNDSLMSIASLTTQICINKAKLKNMKKYFRDGEQFPQKGPVEQW